MMSRSLRWLTLTVVFLCACGSACAQDRVTLYTPVLQGPHDLSQSVATILNLQIWRSLRSAPSPNPNGLSFGLGVVVWGQQPLELYSHEVAEQRAKDISLLAQFVFWGKVYEYGDGALAQTNLSIPAYHDFRQTHPEVWQIEFRSGTETVRFEADIPQRRYSFHPIILDQSIVQRYSQPKTLPIREFGNGGATIGYVGDEFRALRQEAGKVEIESGGKRGWVDLPELSAQRTEAIDFVSGIIRAYRGDWQGVQNLMKSVAYSEQAPNELRTDSILYLGLASEKQGISGLGLFGEARGLSPQARRVVVYRVMGELAQAGRAPAAAVATTPRDALQRAKNILTADRVLFAQSDPWLRETLSKIDGLLKQPAIASLATTTMR